MPLFQRYIGIDYSGAEVPTANLKGLRVFSTDGPTDPVEIPPPPSKSPTAVRRYWSRKDIAHWLVEQLSSDIPTLVGIDHGFSFPLRYFELHRIPPDWPTFLDDFQAHWPTDGDYVYVDFVRDGSVGNGAARIGNSRWRRLCEERAKAKSNFHFDIQGQVAKSTHAGIPWLRHIRKLVGHRVHFWPFDGWSIPHGKSAVVEAYPALYSRGFPRQDRTSDQHDAYSIAAWMAGVDRDESLGQYLQPHLSPPERTVAQVEGWILGVM
ncbi:hypothetical protein [Magnetospirillum sp. XM-1]|uniref:hypothetical protein n=1 Tax=Magnetospirillum sp. XM-1 TaxID=1663591 RepID=UPI0009E7E407|nr:hypothetical protein [Magnetospirillum sp. XM-1]